ncbi:hypothetical protein GPALN_006232 [Globodera pallida]|nr:hypothetical protein GPALN_006232 [Globodera pallida]
MLPSGGGGWRCPTDVCVFAAGGHVFSGYWPAIRPHNQGHGHGPAAANSPQVAAIVLWTASAAAAMIDSIWPSPGGFASGDEIADGAAALAKRLFTQRTFASKKQMPLTITGTGSFWALFFCAMLLQNMFTIVYMGGKEHNGGGHQSSHRGERLRANVNGKNAALAAAGVTALAGGAIAMNKMNKRRANANNDGMPQGQMPMMMPGMMASHPPPNHMAHGY